MANGIVKCDQCGKGFEKKNREINWARKCGYKIFCSGECRKKSQVKTEMRKCLACGCDISIMPSQIRRSETGKFYCGSSCAARMRNLGRHKTEEEKQKISQSLFGKSRDGGNSRIESICVVCGKKFSHLIAEDRQACSISCGQILRFGSLPFTKEEVIYKIKDAADKLGRTPTSKEVVSKLTGAAQKFFGTWNKAIGDCGLDANTEWMRKIRVLCRDGHMADSLSERIVDDWLSEKGIEHERCKTYPKEFRLNCDFYLVRYNVWLEYFGLAGEHKHYDETVERKKKLARGLGLKLVYLLPSDLYPDRKIGEALSRFGIVI